VAIELARRIAGAAPPVSEAKLVKLRLLLHGAGTAPADSGGAYPELPRTMRQFAQNMGATRGVELVGVRVVAMGPGCRPSFAALRGQFSAHSFTGSTSSTR
jgi:hypothetical protein